MAEEEEAERSPMRTRERASGDGVHPLPPTTEIGVLIFDVVDGSEGCGVCEKSASIFFSCVGVDERGRGRGGVGREQDDEGNNSTCHGLMQTCSENFSVNGRVQ